MNFVYGDAFEELEQGGLGEDLCARPDPVPKRARTQRREGVGSLSDYGELATG
jgi:hypothetical protein